MQLIIYPHTNASAAANMAIDLALLESLRADEAGFRCYGWTEPSWTFGYTQRFAEVQAARPSAITACIRRPTGGGIVDHRSDFTYCLAVPPDHLWWRQQVCHVYSEIHRDIAAALQKLDYDTMLQPCDAPRENQARSEAEACFTRAAASDVLDRQSGAKLAGAAMKRNRHGLLIQGSIQLAAAPDGATHARLRKFLGERFQQSLQATTVHEAGSPPQPAGSTIEKFASTAWNDKR